MKYAVIRRKGNIIDVSRDGVTPLPPAVYKMLYASMRYRYVKHLYGDDVIVETDLDTGKKTITRIVSEVKRLYRFDKKGRLMCGSGFIDRIYDRLKAHGYTAAVDDLTPEKPGVFEARWDKLAKAEGRPFTPTAEEKTALYAHLAAGTRPPVEVARRVKQAEIIDVVVRRVSKGLGGAIQAPPGLGKSVMLAAYCLLYPKARIAVVVPGRDNFFKTMRHLTRFVPNVQGQGCGQRSKGRSRVTVVSLDSAHHIDDDTDLILVDEGHKAMAEEATSSLLTVAPNALRFAFTATPEGRMDNLDARMEGLFGPIVYKMEWPEAVALGMVVQIESRILSGAAMHNPLDSLKAHQRSNPFLRKKVGIWHNEDRNALFAKVARTHFEAGDQVLLMVDKIEHALVFHKLLPEATLVYGQQDIANWDKFVKQKLIDEDTFVPLSSAAREEMRQAFEAGELKFVIATDVWSTGVSFDALQVILRADARSSAILDEQIPGRVSRVHDESGKEVGILYDCDDLFDPGARSGAAKRIANYKGKGWIINRLKARTNLAQ